MSKGGGAVSWAGVDASLRADIVQKAGNRKILHNIDKIIIKIKIKTRLHRQIKYRFK
jgi:hypothetical protein